MTTRGPSSPDRRSTARRTGARPVAGTRRSTAGGAVRRDGRSSTVRVRPNRAAPPRPAFRRTAGATGAAPVSLTKSPRSAGTRLTVTTRAALLALTICMVALTMAYPLRAYLTQRSTIGDLREQQREDQQAVAQLQQTIARYQDPASVTDEARRRLHYQLPGEKIYYLPPAPPAAAASDGKVHTPALPGKEDQAWYAQLWGSAVETSK
jgi:cell division protein FtsB